MKQAFAGLTHLGSSSPYWPAPSFHQDEDVGIVIAHGILAHCGLEFINHRGDDALLVIANKLRQVLPPVLACSGSRAATKSLVNLVVEVDAVR